MSSMPAGQTGPSLVLSALSSNIRATGGSPTKMLIGFLVAWAALFLVLYVVPLPEVTDSAGAVTKLSPAGRAALAIVVWASIVWVTESVPVAITGIIIPMLLVMTGAVKGFPAATSAFSSPIVFLCLAAFMFTAIMTVSGLDRRIAISLMNRIRVKEAGDVIWGFLGFNLILSLILPAANARAATMLPIVKGVIELFGDTPREREAKKAIVIQSLVYGAMISGICIMTAHVPNLIVVGLFEKELKLNISYIQWFLLNWPYLIMFVFTQWWVRWYFNTKGVMVPGGRERIARMHAELPKMRGQEWIILAIFGLVALAWVTEKWHGIPTHLVALMGIAVMFIPGLFDLKWKALEGNTIWGTWLLLGGALSMSGAMSSSGLASWLAALVQPVAEGYPWWGTLLIVLVGTHVIRLGMLSNIAAITVLAPILIALAPKLGLNTAAFTMLVANADTFAYLLPTQLVAAVLAYSTGTFSMTDYFKAGWVAVVIAILFTICVMVPWYAFMGFPLWDPKAPYPS